MECKIKSKWASRSRAEFEFGALLAVEPSRVPHVMRPRDWFRRSPLEPTRPGPVDLSFFQCRVSRNS